MNRSKFSTKALMSVGALVTLAAVAGWAASADAAIQTLGPPINPGYAAAPADGLSPILTTPGPVYEFPQPEAPFYPLVQLPGPIDQQKMHAYANSLRAQQWQLQSQGLSTSTAINREILQQLNVPDAQ
jgi:hypothetical protein